MGLRAAWRSIVEGRMAEALAEAMCTPRGRRAQEARDLQRLALASALRGTSGDHALPNRLQEVLLQIDAMPAAEHRRVVLKSVCDQIRDVAGHLHAALQHAGDPLDAATAMQQAAARIFSDSPATSTLKQQSIQHSNSKARLPAAAVADLLHQRLGYSLRVGNSTMPDAGQGLFVRGTARVGSIVALVPGLVYGRTQLARMPNYPKISLDNDYLSSRYDMTIIDSKPWLLHAQRGGAAAAPAAMASTALRALEGRHPLALGHMVNHPPRGVQPNVLEVAWDMMLDLATGTHPAWLRAYLPTAPGLDVPGTNEQGGAEAAAEALLQAELGQTTALMVRGLALVALRTIADGDEVLQAYRLNPAVPRPAWYTPVDEHEDAQRWARTW